MFKRIIFALLYKDNNFYLSRNFSLQKVGDLDWLKKNFVFNETCKSIDELVCLNIDKDNSSKSKISFIKMINELRKSIFIPLTLGGGIKKKEDAKLYFENGADKISICSNHDDINLIKSISEEYGPQSISIFLDYKKNHKGQNLIYINSGTFPKTTISEFFKKKKLLKLVGEIIINSIENDGVGTGLDIKILNNLKKIQNPILLMGGAGRSEHFEKVFKNSRVNGVITANLFNFLGNGLNKTREILIKKNIRIIKFI
jgi:cyclase